MKENKKMIHVKDLHVRDICIVPCAEDKKYYLYDCFLGTVGFLGTRVSFLER